MVDIVVLSDDIELFQATRDAVGERNPVWRARTTAESVDLLLTGRCGVLLLDMATVSTEPASLVEQVVHQFPDVVVVVAGRREDESRLGKLISDGLVYRFMHKPLSPKRAGMFLNAAIRSHAERRDSMSLLPHVGWLHRRLDAAKWLFVAGGVALFLVALGTLLPTRHDAPPAPKPVPARQGAQLAPRADPVMAAARAAHAAGRYEAPPGRNALDLYSAVLLAHPDNEEARAGLSDVIERLLGHARSAAAAGNPAEARRLARRVLEAQAGHPGAQRFLARLDAPAAPPVPSPPPLPATVAPATAADDQLTGAPAADEPDEPTTEETPAPPAPPASIPWNLVPPDPLTPRQTAGPASASSAQRSGRSHSYGAPISSGHPIAGLAAPGQGPADARSSEPPLVSGPATPGLQSRDLQAIATPTPQYPAEARRGHVEGWVEVEFTVDERGTTSDIVIADAEPRDVFDEAVETAVAGWRYRPRVVNGRAVAQRTSVTLHFSLEN